MLLELAATAPQAFVPVVLSLHTQLKVEVEV